MRLRGNRLIKWPFCTRKSRNWFAFSVSALLGVSFLCDDNDGDDDNEFNCLFRVGPFSYSSFSDDPIILIMAEDEKCRSVMLA